MLWSDRSVGEKIRPKQPKKILINPALGYDAGKKIKGRKRFLTVDTLGLVLQVLVTAASVDERSGGKQVLQKVKQMGNTVSRLNTIWVDGGYDGNPNMAVGNGFVPMDCGSCTATS